ncbi:uncharacterized protein LOC122528018 [Frieseomelitta varia]|uniref:uncharacterized protein LOC122528018 n=1 Tax=Frieseomelitta varia TaxID=561572 RepID=UPI001CB69F98|nr:uncharacterized protein LOC122528018 [Frieseomelitta varia]
MIIPRDDRETVSLHCCTPSDAQSRSSASHRRSNANLSCVAFLKPVSIALRTNRREEAQVRVKGKHVTTYICTYTRHVLRHLTSRKCNFLIFQSCLRTRNSNQCHSGLVVRIGSAMGDKQVKGNMILSQLHINVYSYGFEIQCNLRSARSIIRDILQMRFIDVHSYLPSPRLLLNVESF